MADALYSPRLRTSVVFGGAGTAGAYHAGVLRALTESGIKIDILAGHGAGALTALCGAIDGGARLWDSHSPWTQPRLRRAYRWRPALRLGALGLIAAAAILISPLVVLIVAAAFYAASLLTGLVNLPDASAWLIGAYQRTVEALLQPPMIPTVVPRALVIAVLAVLGVLAVAAWRAAAQERSRRRLRGAFWWRLIGSPLDSSEPGGVLIDALWQLVRGASDEPRPTAAEISRRYVDILVDNFGQPGFREVLIAVHDLDARRDLVGGVLTAESQRAFATRRRGQGSREAETVDITGLHRDLVVDLLQGAIRLPLASAPHVLRFPAESYWRGEEHRIHDRPDLAIRLIDEVASLGVEQVILIGAAPPAAIAHGMRARPGDLRGRIGEVLRSIETSALQDAWTAADARFSGVFVVRPDHNPIGPFDFSGSFDEASDRQRTIPELMQQGYEDAYQQFIEPVVAAGDRVDAI